MWQNLNKEKPSARARADLEINYVEHSLCYDLTRYVKYKESAHLNACVRQSTQTQITGGILSTSYALIYHLANADQGFTSHVLLYVGPTDTIEILSLASMNKAKKKKG